MSTSATSPTATADTATPGVIVRGSANAFLQEVTAGKHTFRVDEPVSAGGTESAPDPYDYLLASLGACTSMTVGWYARRNKISLQNVVVALRHSRIHAQDCAECDARAGMLDRIDLDIQLTGPITPEQHTKLMEVAAKCPVHRTLKSEIDIRLRASP
ncbi:MAG: OsmC family protein [Chthoniobacterales bacterium]